MPGLRVAVDGIGLARPLAGVGTYTAEITKALAATRASSSLTVWVPRGVGAPLSAERVAWREVPAARFVGRHVAWPRELRRSRFDVFLGAAGQLPLGGVGCPAVVASHDVAIYIHPEWFPGGQFLSVRVTVPRSFRNAAAICCASVNTADDVAEVFGLPRSRLHVVPLGVSARFRPAPAEAVTAIRQRMGLPDRFVLFVSTVEPRKNLDTLLDAWSRLSDPVPLVIAGGIGWRAEATAARLSSLSGRGVIQLGPVGGADLPALYSAASVLAHPAWYEGFGLTPLEAMASGLPVVTSNSSSLPEVVGDAGILVDPADVEAWTAALERVLGSASEASELRRRGLLRAAAMSWEHTAELTWRVLERAAA